MTIPLIAETTLTLFVAVLKEAIPVVAAAVKALLDSPEAAEDYRARDIRMFVSFQWGDGQAIEAQKTIEANRLQS